MATEANLSATRALGAILIIIIVAAAIGFFAYRTYLPPAPNAGGNPPAGGTSAPASSTPGTGPAASSTGAVQLDSVSPSSGAVGSTVVIAGSGFIADDKVLFNGAVAAADAHPSSSANGRQSLSITVPSSMGADCKPGQACPMYEILVTPRAYSVTVENANGTSNALTFTVTGASVQP